jgi:hypothetical protein
MIDLLSDLAAWLILAGFLAGVLLGAGLFLWAAVAIVCGAILGLAAVLGGER